jgi:recombinational DNA repair protein (RecF pathway)
VTGCAECGAVEGLVGYSPNAGGAVCAGCANGAMRLAPDTLAGIEALLRAPLADAPVLGQRAAREALAVITSSYEFHGGFRLRTLSA